MKRWPCVKESQKRPRVAAENDEKVPATQDGGRPCFSDWPNPSGKADGHETTEVPRVANNELPFSVSGWEEPRVRVERGDKSITGDAERPVEPLRSLICGV